MESNSSNGESSTNSSITAPTAMEKFRLDLNKKLLGVWLLNLFPYSGFGLLMAAGWRALPVLFFMWIFEAMFPRFFNPMLMYLLLSVIGSAIVLIRRVVQSAEEETGDMPYENLDAAGGAIASAKGSINFDIDAGDAVRLNVSKEAMGHQYGESALPSFEQKLKRAELRLSDARNNEDDDAEDSGANWIAAGSGDDAGSGDNASAQEVDQIAAQRRQLESRRKRKEVDAEDERVFGHNPLSDAGQWPAVPKTVSPQQIVLGALQNVLSAAVTAGDAAKSLESVANSSPSENAAGASRSYATPAVLPTQKPASSAASPPVNGATASASVAPDLAPFVEAAESGLDLSKSIPFSNTSVIAGLGELPVSGMVQSIDGYQTGLGSSDGLANLGGFNIDLGNIDSHVSPGIASSAPSAQSDVKLCPKCGADLQGQFSFCLSCLSPLN